MQNIGERIRRLREAKGWSRLDLSIEARMSEQNIRLWEGGRTPSDPSYIAALASALGTTTDYLITGKQGIAV